LDRKEHNEAFLPQELRLFPSPSPFFPCFCRRPPPCLLVSCFFLFLWGLLFLEMFFLLLEDVSGENSVGCVVWASGRWIMWSLVFLCCCVVFSCFAGGGSFVRFLLCCWKIPSGVNGVGGVLGGFFCCRRGMLSCILFLFLHGGGSFARFLFGSWKIPRTKMGSAVFLGLRPWVFLVSRVFRWWLGPVGAWRWRGRALCIFSQAWGFLPHYDCSMWRM
jgi:hypothetical protein